MKKYNKIKCIEAMADGKFELSMCLDCSYLKRCKERWANWFRFRAMKEERKIINDRRFRRDYEEDGEEFLREFGNE